ncbi:MAG TPA: hypothetical protein VE988_10500, partial [Gemmataceae bacterium]|nr:hypothetical protein [Gemmataceae bacterium]
MDAIFDIPTDAKRLERLRDIGDGHAWSWLYREYVPMIREWGRQQRLTPELVDELVSRMLVKLLREMPRF